MKLLATEGDLEKVQGWLLGSLAMPASTEHAINALTLLLRLDHEGAHGVDDVLNLWMSRPDWVYEMIEYESVLANVDVLSPSCSHDAVKAWCEESEIRAAFLIAWSTVRAHGQCRRDTATDVCNHTPVTPGFLFAMLPPALLARHRFAANSVDVLLDLVTERCIHSPFWHGELCSCEPRIVPPSPLVVAKTVWPDAHAFLGVTSCSPWNACCRHQHPLLPNTHGF